MILRKLKLSTFRNYHNLEIEFSPEINVITGLNGSGKTNILEAVSVLSSLKSFRNVNDLSIIKWNSDSYYCRGEVFENDHTLFEVGFYKDGETAKKKIKIDGNEVKRVSDYYGNLITVSFLPSDINILGGTPEIRRRYFDSVISKLYPGYINELNRFREILNSRNIVLKKIREGMSDIKQLEVWNRLFAEKSFVIIHRRNEFTEKFSEIFNRTYKSISGELNTPLLKYHQSINKNSVEDLYFFINSVVKSDIRKGNSSFGPQRDDYIFLNSEGLKFINYASQGQKRTAAISLKTAEYEIIKSVRNKKSIILIDDIFSELDEKRRFNMIDLFMKEGQLIFTMVDNKGLPFDSGHETRFFYASNGIINLLQN